MFSIKRPVAAAGAAAVLALSLTACGGGDDAGDAPKDASKDDFCEKLNALDSLETSDTPSEDEFNDAKDKILELRDVGTPKEITGDAREGFEIFIDAVDDLSYDDAKDLANSDSDTFPGVSEDDNAKLLAFVFSAGALCSGGEIPSDIPTDLLEQ